MSNAEIDMNFSFVERVSMLSFYNLSCVGGSNDRRHFVHDPASPQRPAQSAQPLYLAA